MFGRLSSAEKKLAFSQLQKKSVKKFDLEEIIMGKFKGIMIPITTPYDTNGEILWEEFENHIEIVLSAGAHSILVPSGTG